MPWASPVALACAPLFNIVQHCSTLFNIVQLRVGTCRILAAICRLSMQHPSEILGDSEMWWESSYHWGRNLIPERPGPGPHRRYGAPQWSTSMCWGTQASAAPVTRTPDGIGRDTEIQQNQMLPTLNCQVICIVYWLLYLKSSCLVECFLARVEIWVEIHHREKERCVCVCVQPAVASSFWCRCKRNFNHNQNVLK